MPHWPAAAAALLVVSISPTFAQSKPSAAEIMARVAQNQERAIELRKAYVYRQTGRVRLLKRNGKLLWDETRVYDVTPTPEGSEARLVRTYGNRRKDGKAVPFDVDGSLPSEDGMDAELIDSFQQDLTTQKKTRDGLSANLFPLTSREQSNYQFSLLGEKELHGRKAYRVRFEPRSEAAPWKGEVLVDSAEFQPVQVWTQFALKLPLFVRAVFGVDVHQVGFSLTYGRFDENVWFPVSYGAEFSLKILHFYKRTVIVSMVSEDFRRASAASTVQFESEIATP